MTNRKQRRETARVMGVPFEPVYKGRVITKEQYDKEVLEQKKKLEPKVEVVQESEE